MPAAQGSREDHGIVTAPREPLPVLPERLRFFSHLFLASMVLTWVTSAVPYPYRFAGVATSAAAVTFAVLAIVATRGVERAMVLRVMLAIGGSLALLSLASGAISLVVAPELVAQSRCEQQALTPMALERCEDAFWDSVEARLPVTRP